MVALAVAVAIACHPAPAYADTYLPIWHDGEPIGFIFDGTNATISNQFNVNYYFTPYVHENGETISYNNTSANMNSDYYGTQQTGLLICPTSLIKVGNNYINLTFNAGYLYGTQFTVFQKGERFYLPVGSFGYGTTTWGSYVNDYANSYIRDKALYYWSASAGGWKNLPVDSSGFSTLPESTSTICYRFNFYCQSLKYGSSECPVITTPHVYIVKGDAVTVDAINSQTTTLTNNISSQTTQINNKTQQQTDTMMSTDGAGSVASDVVSGARDTIASRLGFVGQLAGYTGQVLGGVTADESGVVQFPGLNIMGFVIEPAAVDIWEHVPDELHDAVRLAATMLVVVFWFRGMRTLYARIFEGATEVVVDGEGD